MTSHLLLFVAAVFTTTELHSQSATRIFSGPDGFKRPAFTVSGGALFSGWKLKGMAQGYHSGTGAAVRAGVAFSRSSIFVSYGKSSVSYPGIKAYETTFYEAGLKRSLNTRHTLFYPYWLLTFGTISGNIQIRPDYGYKGTYYCESIYGILGFGFHYQVFKHAALYVEANFGSGISSGQSTPLTKLSYSDGLSMEVFRFTTGLQIRL